MERVIASAAARRSGQQTKGPVLGPSAGEMPFTPEELEAAHLAVKGASAKASERLRQALQHRSHQKAVQSARGLSRPSTKQDRRTSSRLPDLPSYTSSFCSPDPDGMLGRHSSCSSRATSPPSAPRSRLAHASLRQAPSPLMSIDSPRHSAAPTPYSQSQMTSHSPRRATLSYQGAPHQQELHRPQDARGACAGGAKVDLEDEAFIQQNKDRANAWINECRPFTWRFEKDKQVWEVQAEERRRDYHFRIDLLRKMGSTPFDAWLSALRSVPRDSDEFPYEDDEEEDTLGHRIFNRMFVEQRCEKSRWREAAQRTSRRPSRRRQSMDQA